MLRLLVDESSGRRLFNLLKSSYDVVFIGDVMQGCPDVEVLRFAEKENMVLITDDKDFGEFIFRLGKPSKGVILLRMRTTDLEKRFMLLKNILGRFDSFDRKFIVLTEKSARIRSTEGI
ncbi:MAG: DUF5615 family PIN-like protein [Candidatus Altiarchaeota archaeon]|nr:DUF5615 family PIN-like protein [Candidatus Altiarchaeota archaeon]